MCQWRKQQEYTKKEDALSPTVSVDLILITASIEVQKSLDVSVINLSQTLLHAKCDKEIALIMDG